MNSCRSQISRERFGYREFSGRWSQQSVILRSGGMKKFIEMLKGMLSRKCTALTSLKQLTHLIIGNFYGDTVDYWEFSDRDQLDFIYKIMEKRPYIH